MTVAEIIAGLLPSCLAVAPALKSCDDSQHQWLVDGKRDHIDTGGDSGSISASEK